MLKRYTIAVRGTVPNDVVARVSAAHASAVLQRQAGLRPSAQGRDVRERLGAGKTQHQEERHEDV